MCMREKQHKGRFLGSSLFVHSPLLFKQAKAKEESIPSRLSVEMINDQIVKVIKSKHFLNLFYY